MSVDNTSSGDNSFSNAALNQLLFQSIENQQLGYDFSSPQGATLAGGYIRDQILGALADRLAKASGSAPITGKNGLFRMNWFDGRFLTAQALKQQDTYWDQRLRLLAQIFPPGVSWGLGLSGLQATLQVYPPRGDDIAYVRSGGTSLDQSFTLHPGVAFDGIGRPIVVGQDFCFCFRDLISGFQSEPRQVTASGQRFQSCLCLEPFNGGAGTPGSTVPPGPYLLTIEPREGPEGDAKVYGEACAGDQPARCQSDGWRGGFGLSLVRFPADPPSDIKVGSAWDLRGILSAYYYDVFEHSLISRWDPEFARDDGFCEAVGNDCQQAGAVPLAMVYIGFDGSVLFLDQWIPRRGLAATAAANWTQTHIGAPSRAASQARVHQFQCMLKQSLAKAPLETTGQQAGLVLNLHDRGFRHIPPAGFLPFDPYTTLTDLSTDTGNDTTGGDLLTQLPAFANTVLVEKQIDRYFCGTSVIPYYVVALHEDDLIQDFEDVFYKDPVRVGRLSAIDDSISKWISDLCRETDGPFGTITDVLTRFVKVVIAVFQVMLRDTDLLVNRDIELVKVVIPLQGLRRTHPLVGITDLDTASSLRDWYSRPPGETGNTLSDLARDRLVQFLRERFGMDALPRHFAVYVKQRLVLLDALYVLFELFNQFLAFVDSFDRAGSSVRMPTESFRQQHLAQPQYQQAAARAALTAPLVQEVIAFSLVNANAELANPPMWDSFFEQVDLVDARLASEITDPVLRRQRALDLVADAQGDEIEGFETLKLLIAVQDPDSAEASLRGVQRAAKVTPALDQRGVPRDISLNQEVLHGGKLRVFEKQRSRELWRAVTTGLSQQPASNLIGTVATDVTVAEVLKLPAKQAEKLLGGSSELNRFRSAIQPKIDKIAEDIDVVAADSLSAKVIERFHKNLAAADADPVRALAQTQAEFKSDAKATASLKRLEPVADLLGKDGFQPVAAVLFRQLG